MTDMESCDECAGLKVRLREMEKRLEEANKTIQGELMDPNGTIWETAARLEKELAQAKADLREARVKAFEDAIAEAEKERTIYMTYEGMVSIDHDLAVRKKMRDEIVASLWAKVREASGRK